MALSSSYFQRVTDRAVKIKRTLAIRSRIIEFWIKFLAKARRNRFGLEIPRDIYLDHKYGGWCGGIIRSPYPQLGARGTQSIHYWQLMKLFREVPIRETDILVDVGCGKGRVINYWLHMGCNNPIIGVELNEKVAEWTRERLKGYPNVTIICGNILNHIPSGSTLFFLYNPFLEPIWRDFKAALEQKDQERSDVRVLYHHCLHRDVFDNDPAWEVVNLSSAVVGESILLRIKDRRQGRSD